MINSKDLKSKISPEEFFVSEGLTLGRPNRCNWAVAGLCCFHNDHRPGSFLVNLTNGAFKCFSCGAAGGDIIEFTKLRYNISFEEALEKIANDFGLRGCL